MTKHEINQSHPYLVVPAENGFVVPRSVEVNDLGDIVYSDFIKTFNKDELELIDMPTLNVRVISKTQDELAYRVPAEIRLCAKLNTPKDFAYIGYRLLFEKIPPKADKLPKVKEYIYAALFYKIREKPVEIKEATKDKLEDVVQDNVDEPVFSKPEKPTIEPQPYLIEVGEGIYELNPSGIPIQRKPKEEIEQIYVPVEVVPEPVVEPPAVEEKHEIPAENNKKPVGKKVDPLGMFLDINRRNRRR